MTVNGREYPMWGQFVEQKSLFIGGVLEDLDDDPMLDNDGSTTIITDITLRPNGSDSAYFRVHGVDYECGFDVSVGGVGATEPGWITVCGYGGHTWRFKKPSLTTRADAQLFREPGAGALPGRKEVEGIDVRD